VPRKLWHQDLPGKEYFTLTDPCTASVGCCEGTPAPPETTGPVTGMSRSFTWPR
jgi:hypothetical protein